MTGLISNPPYNIKWEHPPFAQIQPRFSECELPPENNANYAFILTALNELDGKAVFILPTGILATEQKQEKEIRKYLVEMNYVESVIMCPDGMFESTSIPVCLIVFNKAKITAEIAMIDMRNTCHEEIREQRGQFGGKSHESRTYKKRVKVFTEADMEKALDAISSGRDEEGFCRTVTIETVKEQDYLLSPARYIDLPEVDHKHREYKDIVADVNRIVREKNACKLTINETLAKALGFDIELYRKDQDYSEVNAILGKVGANSLEKSDYFRASKNKNEIRFENNSKDVLSSVLLMILQTWKQHIYYLNIEENRYLAELRDALLEDLMSGKVITERS